MVCNLAVAITKAALSDERLKALIDEHIDQVMQMIEGFLRRRHPSLALGPARPGTHALPVGDGLTLTVVQGVVRIEGKPRSRTAQYMEELNSETSAFLKLAADTFFTLEVERVLKSTAQLTGKQTRDVENAGTVQRATVYSIQKGGLKARVFVLPNARLQICIDTGTFVQAKSATQELLQQMQVQGLDLQMTSEVEQHRDDVDHVHIRQAQQRRG